MHARPFETNAATRMAGVMFLYAIIASIIGGAVLEPLMSGPGRLERIAAATPAMALGMVLEFSGALSVLMIGAGLYPALRRASAAGAVAYGAMKALEATLFFIAALVPVMLLLMSREPGAYSDAGGALLLVLYAAILNVGMPVIFAVGALTLYVLTYRADMLPRWLTIWGLIAAIMVFCANVWPWPIAVQAVLVLPIIANETVLSLWLMIKGLRAPATTA